MKKLLLVSMMLVAGAAVAQTSHATKGYVKKDGTYVAPSRATNPNSTKLDNYSTEGNVNPYTGKAGTVDPYKVESLRIESLRIEQYKPYKPYGK